MYTLIKTNYKDLYWCKEQNKFYLCPLTHSECLQVSCPDTDQQRKVSFNLPLNLVWRVTNLCNLSCRHCFAKKRELKNADKIRQNALHQLLKMPPPKLNFTGGEPVLTPQFTEILHKLKEKQIILTLTSNGLVIDRYINEVSEYIDWFILSLDHYLPEKHDLFRNKEGLFVKCMNAVEHLLEDGQMVRVNSVISSKNIDDMESMVAYFKNTGIRCYELIQFLPKNNALDVKDDYAVSETKFLSMATELKAKYESENFNIKINANTTFKEYMIIEDDGFLYTVNTAGEYVRNTEIKNEFKHTLPVLEIEEKIKA